MPGRHEGLSNQLLGRRIVPKPEYGDPATQGNSYPDANGRIWEGLKPSLNGEYTAEIDAVWQASDGLQISVHDPFGNIAEMALKNVSLQM